MGTVILSCNVCFISQSRRKEPKLEDSGAFSKKLECTIFLKNSMLGQQANLVKFCLKCKLSPNEELGGQGKST